jgi:hypothetical protein
MAVAAVTGSIVIVVTGSKRRDSTPRAAAETQKGESRKHDLVSVYLDAVEERF